MEPLIDSYLKSHRMTMNLLDRERIRQLGTRIFEIWQKNGTTFVAGNGGSASTASHFVCDITKLTAAPGLPRVRAVSLSDNVPLMTAWGNDSSYAEIFAEQGIGLIRPGDLVLCISGSGNSPNILRLAAVGREKGAFTAALSGFNGGKLKDLVDLAVIVPSDNMQIIEDQHLAICHMLALFVRSALRNATKS